MSLGPDARALLDAAEGGDDPSAADAARVRRKLAAQLAVGAAAGVTAATITKSAGGATAGAGAAAGVGASAGAGAVPMTSLLSAKVIVAVALVGGATATSAVVMHERAPMAAVSAAASPPAPPSHRAIPTVAEVTGSAPTPAEHEKTANLEATSPTLEHAPRAETGADGSAPRATAGANALDRSPARGSAEVVTSDERGAVPNRGAGGTSVAAATNGGATGTRAGAAADAPRPAPAGNAPAGNAAEAPRPAPPPAAEAPRPAPAPRDSVAEEAALLRAANAALAHGDGTAALARIDEHASRFPRGALVEERDAARVLALCAAGRAAESRAAASKFVSANPRSPFVAQVRRACTTP